MTKMMLIFCSLTVALGQDKPQAAQEFNVREQVDWYLYRTFTSKERLAWFLADSLADQITVRARWNIFAPKLGLGYSSRILYNSLYLGTGLLFKEDMRYKPLG